MVKILNSSNETMAILENVVSPIVSEEINREFTFSFTTVIDNDKSNYVNYQHKAEAEDNYFNIVYTEDERTLDGIYVKASCEHVSYELISATLTAGFTATGPFSAVATTLLSGTGFTLGTVEITASQTISVNESTNKRYVLIQLAALYSGELKFEKYVISLLTRRGADRGAQFRYRKNLVGVKRIVDNRKKVGGLPTTSYEVSAAELEFEQGYIADGVSSIEHYELGDTVKTIDEDLSLDTPLRIVSESHDVNQRMQGQVKISNFVDDLADTLTTIQTTSVSKDTVYNGCSIGPENGFVAERSDGIAKTSMNATDGISIGLRDVATASYTSVFYVQIDTATNTAKLYLVGNAVFTGTVQGSSIIGGSIVIGTGSNTFNANGTNGIWLGYSAFATAPFKVTLSGSATANDLNITGGLINIGTGTNTFQFNTTDGLFLGATSVATAPFSVTMSGAMTVNDATITGGTIRTGLSGTKRLELSSGIFRGFTSSNETTGLYFTIAGTGLADIYLYHNDAPLAVFYDGVDHYTLRGTSAATSFRLGGALCTTCGDGAWDFSGATVTGLGASGTIYTSASQTITVNNGLITNIA